MAEYGVDPNRYPLNGVPVGTILPYVARIDALPVGWVLCDGRQITDAESPFVGLTIPAINDSRYLNGVGNAESVNESVGTNDLPDSGNHDHGGTSAEVVHEPSPLGFQKEGGNCHTHNHGITAGGQHNHGGDNRPQSWNVWFIIRIK